MSLRINAKTGKLVPNSSERIASALERIANALEELINEKNSECS